jgi:hypothetical protein
MKIIILGPPRSGSSCLYKSLYGSINYTMGLFEPISPYTEYKAFPYENFNKINNHLEIIRTHPTNIVEKNVIILPNLDTNTVFNLDTNTVFNFYKNYLTNFDKIILLYRNNIKEHAESYKTSIITNNWENPYRFTEIDYTDVLPILKSKNKVILQLADFFNIPLTYYEDLYSNNKEYLNNFLNFYNIKLDNYEHFIHNMNTKNRLKQIL